MSEEFVLDAESRDVMGKGSSRRLRRLEDKVPAIVYGGKDKKTPENITLAHKDIQKATQNEAFFSHIITLNIGENSQQVILKDLQRHPAKPVILHADFLRVNSNVAINVQVPIHLANEEACIGVKLQGGLIARSMTEVEISCLPAKLPEYLEVDMAEVELGTTLHLSDIILPEGVDIVALTHGDDHDLPIASINEPKAAPEEDEDTAAPEAPDAPQVGDGEGEEESGEE